jgi:hypothetical protein
MVAAGGQRAAVANSAIAQANVPAVSPPSGPASQGRINLGAEGAGMAAGPPPVPNVIAAQPHGLPLLTPSEEALIGIGFSKEAARILTSPNDQKFRFLL